MAKTPDQISKEILAKLAVTAPAFSLELGTPERKIVDAVAESISSAYVDQYLVGSLLDIESKGGLELEQWVGIFGFGRLQGRKATGIVRVELGTANSQDVAIQMGSQFYTRSSLPGTGSPLYFASTQSIVIPAGTLVADIPVECVQVGAVGNVAPDSIVFLGEVLGAQSVTNLQAFTGGVDAETDDELRQRFKDTFLRNIAGTEDWYLGLAYQNKSVSKATCFGPIRKYVTQIPVPSVTHTFSLPDVKYAWPQGETVFKDLGQDTEKFYRPSDDYTFLAGSSPQLNRVSSGDMTIGEIVDVEFDYTPAPSRNDPLKGVTNKVDLFVNGADPATTTERTRVTDTPLTNVPSDELYIGNFARVGTPGTPEEDNLFMRLGSTPVLSFPSTITRGLEQFQQGTHYHLLRGTTLTAGSVREVAGIEWTAVGLAAGNDLTVTYVYNRVPEVLNAIVTAGKQITTDVLVHQASYAYLRPHLSVEYDRGYVVSQVNNAIQERLRTYFTGLPYGAWIEISDLCLAVHQVLGVDNVWLTRGPDHPDGQEHATDYGIKQYGNSADTVHQALHTGDFKLADNALPVFLDAKIIRKANR